MPNPIIKGYFADPDIAYFNGRFYLYPTTDGVKWEPTEFRAFSSTDLVNWKDEGVVLDLADVPWTEGKKAWAPAIGEKNGKYYFYYTANQEYIGVAVGESPIGPFVDIGKPLLTYKQYGGRSIDPDFFLDDDGQAYLYWGNKRLHAAKLADDYISFDGEVVDITPPWYNEAPCVFKRKGIYYFTWSVNDARSPEYQVRWAKSDDPMMRPRGDHLLLSRDNATDSRIKGTGHHAVFNIPGTDDWYIVYHRFNAERFGNVNGFCAEAGYNRELCIDKLCFSEDGNLKRVIPTMEGVSL